MHEGRPAKMFKVRMEMKWNVDNMMHTSGKAKE